MSPPAGVLRVETITTNGVPVLHVHGDVDLRSSPQLRTLLLDSADRFAGPVLVDLSGVEYMDSSGVGTMVFVKREVERHGRRLVLIALQPRVRSVLEITHLDKFFTIVNRLEEVPTP